MTDDLEDMTSHCLLKDDLKSIIGIIDVEFIKLERSNRRKDCSSVVRDALEVIRICLERSAMRDTGIQEGHTLLSRR